MDTEKKVLLFPSSATRYGKTLMMKAKQLKYAKGQQKVLLHEELLGRPIQ